MSIKEIRLILDTFYLILFFLSGCRESPATLASPSLGSVWAPARLNVVRAGQLTRFSCWKNMVPLFDSGHRKSSFPVHPYRAAGNRTRSSHSRSVYTTGILQPETTYIVKQIFYQNSRKIKVSLKGQLLLYLASSLLQTLTFLM